MGNFWSALDTAPIRCTIRRCDSSETEQWLCSMDVKYCQGCGLKVLSTFRFCPACGASSLGVSPPGNLSGTTAQGATPSSPPSIGLPGPLPVQSAPVFAPPPPLTTPPPVAAMPVSSFSLPAGMQVGSEPSLFSLFVGAVTKRYFQFSGRARRREYWAFNLFYFIGAFLFGCALGFGGVTDENKIRGSIIVFYCFPTAIPSVSILVRRLHDVGISGYLALFYYAWIYGGPAAFLLVFAGINRPKEQFPEFFLTAIAWASGVWGCSLIILYCVIFYYTVKRGGQGTNRFGPDPKLIAGTNHGFGHLGATAPHPVAHHSSSANPLSGQWPSPPS